MDLSHHPVYKKTKSYSYLYPMIHDQVPEGFKNRLVNVFLGDTEYPELDNHLFLLYRFSGDTGFPAFENAFANSPLFVKSYDPDKFHVMKVFAISKDLQYNYQTFRKSKYSHLTDDHKKTIVSHWNLKPDHLVTGVLYKKEFAFKAMEDIINRGLDRSLVTIDRNQEASSILDMDREMYNTSLKVYDPITTLGEKIAKDEY